MLWTLVLPFISYVFFGKFLKLPELLLLIREIQKNTQRCCINETRSIGDRDRDRTTDSVPSPEIPR